MIKRYFVTGTDTAVGKTIASMALLQAASSAGFTTAGYKPVASGSKMTIRGARNSDALILQCNSSIFLTYETVNPYTFIEPTSPHIVSFDEKRPISLKTLSAGLRILEKKANWVLIEGAGGWFTLLTEKITLADWVVRERLPIILVVGIKLGCINHALLTSLAIRRAKLHLAGWIANGIVAPGRRHIEYVETLKKVLSAPFIGEIPWISNPEKCKSLGRYLDLEYLEHN